MQKNLHFFGGGGYGVDMQLIFPGHTVDLRDRIMLIQYLCDLRQTAWRCFDLKIAGYRSADLLVMMKEMSYIVIGGLIASTVLAMFLVPPFYLLMRGERVDGSKPPPLFKKKNREKSPVEAALSAAGSNADET